MKKLLFLFLILVSTSVFSQKVEVPQDFDADNKEDCHLFIDDFISCFNWLMKNPANLNPNLKKEVNSFLLEWMVACPQVKIQLDSRIANFIPGSNDYLMVFLAGWSKYSLENDDTEDLVQGNLAGLNAVIDYYTKNKSILGKSKNIEKYIKMKQKGELQSHIEKIIAN